MTAYGGKELAASFRTVRGNTIKTVEEIPDDQFGFVAAPGSRSVAQLVAHITNVAAFHLVVNRDEKLTTIAGFNFPGLMATLGAEEAKLTTKAQLLAALR